MTRKLRIKRIYYRPRPQADERAPIRLGLVLSGAVALGSFEAGAVYELLRASAAGAPLLIDLVAGSSAGAVVGALATRSLVTGLPFEPSLQKWTDITLAELTAEYQTKPSPGRPLDRGILSSLAVNKMLRRYLVDAGDPPRYRPRYVATRFVFTLTMTNLDGLPPQPQAGQEAAFSEAVTYHFRLPEGDRPPLVPGELWERMAQACQASSSFPGMFDPQRVAWRDRIRIPGLVDESWENDSRIGEMEQAEPGAQSRMHYADGGVLDNHPIERAIALLPKVTGEAGEAGVESLVYDPRRTLLFIEPNPPATTLDVLKAGVHRTWLDTFLRAARLWTLSAAPYTSERRLAQANERQRILLHFMAELAQRMQSVGRPLAAAGALTEFTGRLPWGIPLPTPGSGAAGPLDPELHADAVAAFYDWLMDDQRFAGDMAWLDTLPDGPVRQRHADIRAAAGTLREAYAVLAPDLADSVREIHVLLGASLGLTQPWVALHEITPDDPELMLRGEELGHFGGFFSREFLRHDFQVGRHYAHRWLTAAIPGYRAADPPELPPPAIDGLNWRLLWQNRVALWRMAGRLTSVLLEMIDPCLARFGMLICRVALGLLGLSILHSLFLLATGWYGIRTMYQVGILLMGATVLMLAPLIGGVVWLLWYRRK